MMERVFELLSRAALFAAALPATVLFDLSRSMLRGIEGAFRCICFSLEFTRLLLPLSS